MVIKGTVQNGQIHIDNSVLPDGTQVLITPVIPSLDVDAQCNLGLQEFKDAIGRIAQMPSEGKLDDNFCGADHDKLLYSDSK